MKTQVRPMGGFTKIFTTNHGQKQTEIGEMDFFTSLI